MMTDAIGMSDESRAHRLAEIMNKIPYGDVRPGRGKRVFLGWRRGDRDHIAIKAAESGEETTDLILARDEEQCRLTGTS